MNREEKTKTRCFFVWLVGLVWCGLVGGFLFVFWGVCVCVCLSLYLPRTARFLDSLFFFFFFFLVVLVSLFLVFTYLFYFLGSFVSGLPLLRKSENFSTVKELHFGDNSKSTCRIS